MARFRAKLEPVSHGGHYVVVPHEVAEAAGLRTKARVRGTVDGVPYRSSLMKYSGVFHMGVHKATLAKAGVEPGARVEVTIEIDDEPLPTDIVPDDFAKAIAKKPTTAAAWKRLAPSHKREHVKHILEAKKPETRARRIAKAIEMLAEAASTPRRRK
jgi:bifunctional DNA-binding transcriptional regulator/antitoxin component of YhaV-PrlF toxin-antitoxin module